MKKYLALFLFTLLVVSLATGCSGGSSSGATYSDPAQTITVQTGEEFVIALESNPTTGYDWEESHDAGMLSLVNDNYEAGQKAKEGLVGAGGTHYFKYKALKSGKTEITLTYKRSWEEESADQKIFTVDIK
jgi:inhibitor of cysteine peptidase